MKTLNIEDITALVLSIKRDICDDCRAHEDDETPGILLTVGADDSGDWSYQTGDNSFSGGAYGFPFWGVAAVYRRSNSRDVARDIIGQIEDQLS
jgi:hypothetical protein